MTSAMVVENHRNISAINNSVSISITSTAGQEKRIRMRASQFKLYSSFE